MQKEKFNVKNKHHVIAGGIVEFLMEKENKNREETRRWLKENFNVDINETKEVCRAAHSVYSSLFHSNNPYNHKPKKYLNVWINLSTIGVSLTLKSD